jgi:hypothetical protein
MALTGTGGSLRVLGTNFPSNPVVMLGAVTATVTSSSSTEIDVQVGCIAAGNYGVTVYNASQSQSASFPGAVEVSSQNACDAATTTTASPATTAQPGGQATTTVAGNGSGSGQSSSPGDGLSGATSTTANSDNGNAGDSATTAPAGGGTITPPNGAAATTTTAAPGPTVSTSDQGGNGDGTSTSTTAAPSPEVPTTAGTTTTTVYDNMDLAPVPSNDPVAGYAVGQWEMYSAATIQGEFGNDSWLDGVPNFSGEQ